MEVRVFVLGDVDSLSLILGVIYLCCCDRVNRLVRTELPLLGEINKCDWTN